MTDRELVLSRIRKALGHPREDPAAAADRRAGLSRAIETLPGDLVKQFARECEAQAVHVYSAGNPLEAGEILSGILSRLRVERVFAGRDDILEEEGIRSRIRSSQVVDLTPAEDSRDRDTLFALAARADMGITGVDWALADTGTLVLISNPGRSRSASLLPRVHTAIVRESRILRSLDDLIPLLPQGSCEARGKASNVTLITGPSKTADIELILVRGVHGPAEVHVIVIREAKPE